MTLDEIKGLTDREILVLLVERGENLDRKLDAHLADHSRLWANFRWAVVTGIALGALMIGHLTVK